MDLYYVTLKLISTNTPEKEDATIHVFSIQGWKVKEVLNQARSKILKTEFAPWLLKPHYLSGTLKQPPQTVHVTPLE